MKKRKTPEGVRDLRSREDSKRYVDIHSYINNMDYEDLLHLGYSLDFVDGEKWPGGLPFKPDDWDSIGVRARIRWLMHIQGLCEIEVGEKALSRYKHKIEEGWTDQQFEDWWESKQTRRLAEELEDRERNRQYSSNKGHYGYYLCIAMAAFELGVLFMLLFH